MGFLRRRRPTDGLDEAECYQRLHGERDSLVRVLEPEDAGRRSPYWYWKRHPNPRISGEELRRQLLARLEARRDPERQGAQVALETAVNGAPGGGVSEAEPDAWVEGGPYERYVGRWSRRVAAELLDWLEVGPGRRWLDVGCGTGALTETILEAVAPREVVGVDPSRGFVEYARSRIEDGRARFLVGDALELPFGEDSFDAVVSGLVLNFVSEPERAVAEIARVTARAGVASAYVWDYSGEMEVIRRFWDAAVALDPAAADLHEGHRFPVCQPEELERLFRGAGFAGVETRAIDVAARFVDFEDYWLPFLGGQGPAGAYAVSLPEERRVELREALRASLPANEDGSIALVARAWAVRGRDERASRGLRATLAVDSERIEPA